MNQHWLLLVGGSLARGQSLSLSLAVLVDDIGLFLFGFVFFLFLQHCVFSSSEASSSSGIHSSPSAITGTPNFDTPWIGFAFDILLER